jgi:sugar phosphate isomerase/epimerase
MTPGVGIAVGIHTPPLAPLLSLGELGPTLEAAAGAGYESVDLLLRHPEDVRDGGLSPALAELGLGLRAILTGPANTVDGLALAEPRGATAAVERVATMVALAAEHGAAVVLGWLLGRLPDGPGREDGLATLVDSLRRCASVAACSGVPLLIEPVNRYEGNVAATAEDAVALADRAGGGIGVLLDAFHANIEEADPIGTARRFAARAGHVHVADSNRRVPGDGHFPLAAWVQALREGGYRGPLAVEAQLGDEPAAAAARARDACRRLEP